MQTASIDEAITWLEKANADLEPELLSAEATKHLLASYAKAEKLAAYGKTMLANKLDDAFAIAHASGTSMGKAKAIVDAGKTLSDTDEVREAFKNGDISLDQATEISRAEQKSPGSASELLSVAHRETFQVLRDKARKVVLEAEQHRGLAQRQHDARRANSHTDELGMIHIHLALEPHVGVPIVTRAETEAGRLYRAAKKEDRIEPFEAHLADAYAGLLSGSTTTTRSRRPEVVVLVSHEVATRGWTDIRTGEVCRIPGVGPISPQVAKNIAQDAFLNGVFCDGKDLRQFKRWTRNIPVEVLIALELGEPPAFDGVVCTDCGNRFRTENDHVQPRVAHGPTSTANLKPRCWSCHRAKTERDRKAGKLTPRDPDVERAPP
jgi:HNH endonuclease